MEGVELANDSVTTFVLKKMFFLERDSKMAIKYDLV